MTDYTNLTLSIDGHTATLTLNNPPAHTWTMDSLQALKQLITDLNANDDVYALIVHGDGEKFFSAGADLNNFSDGDKETPPWATVPFPAPVHRGRQGSKRKSVRASRTRALRSPLATNPTGRPDNAHQPRPRSK